MKKGNEKAITMKGVKKGVLLRVPRRAGNPVKKGPIVWVSEETVQEVYMNARMLSGFDGIVANGYGLGVRVKEERTHRRSKDGIEEGRSAIR